MLEFSFSNPGARAMGFGGAFIGLADRFEVYLGGLELGNAFAEELDSAVLRASQAAANVSGRGANMMPSPASSR